MLYFAPWKVWSIIATVVLAIVYALPNALPRATQAWLAERTAARPMTLGLDLQGGLSILYETDRGDLRKQKTTQLVGDIRAALAHSGLQRGPINRIPEGVIVRMLDAADADKAEPILRKLIAPEGFNPLANGARPALFDVVRQGDGFVFSFSPDGFARTISAAVDRSVEVLKLRLDGRGVKEVSVQRQGEDRILVQIPGIQSLKTLERVLPSSIAPHSDKPELSLSKVRET